MLDEILRYLVFCKHVSFTDIRKRRLPVFFCTREDAERMTRALEQLKQFSKPSKKLAF
jgi:hypothetical protein